MAILVRLIRGPKDSEGKRIVFITNLLDEDYYPSGSICELYRQRWNIETQYGRIKNQLKLENFHSKSLNGIKQEIYANLTIMSIAAAIEYQASRELKLDRSKKSPSFKAAIEVVRRNLLIIIGRTNLNKA